MTKARWLSFFWSRERQEIACDGERFAHPLPVSTSPSHDVAHLLVAASWLPWKPTGTRDEICASEFNSVLLEHLAVDVLDAIVLGHSAHGSLPRVLEYARHFAEVHYAPFPVSFEDAVDRFCEGLDAETILRLSPVFFRTRAFELAHQDRTDHVLSASFSSAFTPESCALTRSAREALARQLGALQVDSELVAVRWRAS